jgi:protocatechuate 4,5-dioxygenase, alpha chain
MTKPESPLDDIPGTVLFDGERSRQGAQFNRFCMSLNKPENRAAFLANQPDYLAKFPISEAQRLAVLQRDWSGMLQLGGNIFYIIKIAMCDGVPVQHVQAAMSGMTNEDYVQMMLAGGRSIEGNRSKKEKLSG